MVIECVDLTRGLNSLALYNWLNEHMPEVDTVPIRLWSGFGEPNWIPWEEIVEEDIINLYWGWTCSNCGRTGDEKVPVECANCRHVVEPKTVHWGGIHDWKAGEGRLTFRYSAHPF